VIGPVASVADAMAAIDEGTPDVALLDINLGGTEKAFPVADRLQEMGVPFALVSGYDPRGIDGYDDAVKLQKPFSINSLEETVKALRAKVLIG
jgi:DNA-binding response OmpR family regulator